jgi:hypothetical protein
VLCIFEGTSEEAEELCKERTKHTGHKHDWHTFAGRKVVKYLAPDPDTIQVSRAEYEALRRDAEQMAAAILGISEVMTWGERYTEAGQNLVDTFLTAHKYAAADAAINMPANGEGEK